MSVLTTPSPIISSTDTSDSEEDEKNESKDELKITYECRNLCDRKVEYKNVQCSTCLERHLFTIFPVVVNKPVDVHASMNLYNSLVSNFTEREIIYSLIMKEVRLWEWFCTELGYRLNIKVKGRPPKIEKDMDDTKITLLNGTFYSNTTSTAWNAKQVPDMIVSQTIMGMINTTARLYTYQTISWKGLER